MIVTAHPHATLKWILLFRILKLCVPSDRLNEASEAKGDKILYSKASLTTSNSFSSDFN